MDMDYMFMRDVAEVEVLNVVDTIERTYGHGTSIPCRVKGPEDSYVIRGCLTYLDECGLICPIVP